MIKIKQTISALFLGISVCATQAIEFKSTELLTVSTDESVTNEIWHSAQQIDFQGTALQDLFLLSSDQLKLSGEFKEDVWGGATTASFKGNSAGSVRLAAQNSITVEGNVGGNLIAAVPNINRATVKLTENSSIQGAAICFGDNVILEGTTADITIYANKATIGGEIKGNATVVARDIVVLNNTRIAGDLNYLSGEELLVPNSVQVGGQLKQLPIPVKPAADLKNTLVRQGYFFIAAILVTIPFLNLFPNYAANAVAIFRITPWRCLLIGFAALFIIPFCCITLCASIIGMPLGLILGGWYAILLYLSKIVFALVIGVLIFRWKKPPAQKSTVIAAIAGLFVIYVLTSIQFIKTPIWLMIAMYGTGALILATFKKVRLVVPTPPNIPQTLSDDNTETK
ncbi:hypothetical protein ACFLQY_01340 [Verrucomicrobiota bacterium]